MVSGHRRRTHTHANTHTHTQTHMTQRDTKRDIHRNTIEGTHIETESTTLHLGRPQMRMRERKRVCVYVCGTDLSTPCTHVSTTACIYIYTYI